MAPSTRDRWLIVIFLAIIVLNNALFFHRGGWDMYSWLSGLATGVLLVSVILLGVQIIKRTHE